MLSSICSSRCIDRVDVKNNKSFDRFMVSAIDMAVRQVFLCLLMK